MTAKPRTRMTREVCASLAAIAAQADGYQPVVALDACGTFSHHKREAGLARLTARGIEVSDYATAMIEVMADNADPKANDATPPWTCHSGP